MAARTRAAVRQPAPSWSGTSLWNGDFEELASEHYRGQYLVVFFYPNDFTFVCPTELLQLSEKIPEFSKLHCAVVACSCDSQYSHLAWCQTDQTRGGLGHVEFPILADPTHKIASDFGVLVEDKGIALRGTFIIDSDGIIRSSIINDTQVATKFSQGTLQNDMPQVGRNIDEILRLVQAFQYADQHGEVCPESWRPGQKAITSNYSLQPFRRRSQHMSNNI